MPTIHYYGKKNNFVGKTLFEILGNLRNFGLNRMLIKQEEVLQFPGKPSYYIVKKVEPVMDETLQQGAIYAERIFKGARMPGLVFVDDESWHNDWQLVPRHEESKYLVVNPPEYQGPQVEKASFELPPLMAIFLSRHKKVDANKSATLPLDYKPREVQYPVDVSKPLSSLLMDRFRNQ